MAKLPKALIKKYGISKKAWAIFRGSKSRSTKRVRSSSMAKKRYFGKKSKSGLGGDMALIFGAGIYGGLRQKISEVMMPVTANIPFGNIADEIAIGGTAYVLKKTLAKKFPMIKPVLNAAITVESARIGEAIATGQLTGNANSSSGEFIG